ncbi:unnamed protein product, partial [Ectocarpus sp. 8 AP-2014]
HSLKHTRTSHSHLPKREKRHPCHLCCQLGGRRYSHIRQSWSPVQYGGRSAASKAQISRVQILIFSDIGQQHTVSQTQIGRRIGTVARKHKPRSTSKRSQASN